MLRSVRLWIRVENYIGDVVTLVKKHIESVQTLLRVSERMHGGRRIVRAAFRTNT